MEKHCPRCDKPKPVTEFGRDRKTKDGLQSCCKECRRKEGRDRYAANPEPIKARSRKSRPKRVATVKKWIHSIRDASGCKLCGDMEPCALDFHHIGDKDRPISRMFGQGIGKIEAEIRKCVVLCASCHRKVHAGVLTVSPEMACNETFPRSVRFPPKL